MKTISEKLSSAQPALLSFVYHTFYNS